MKRSRKILTLILALAMVLAAAVPAFALYPTASAGFTDVSSSAVDWAVAQGITEGTSATTFSPNKTCTRGQIVTFLYRYLGK